MSNTTINPKLILRALSHPRSGDIHIDDAPFVIGRLEEPFISSDALDVATLSRRHAQISAKKGRFHVVDLKAKNGTTLNGRAVNGTPAELRNGDELRFASFAYRVELPRESAGHSAEPSVEKRRSISQHANTTFVESADAFMELFYAPQLARHENHRSRALRPFESGISPGRMRNFANRALVALPRIQCLLADSARRYRRRRIALFGGLVSSVVILALVLLFAGSVENDMRALLAEQAYAKSLALASHHLRERPDDAAVQALATEVLLKAVVPQWQQALHDREFTAAQAMLDRARTTSATNSDGQALLKLLGWVGEVLRFIAERGGPDGRIALFDHEEDIDALIAYWRRDPAGNRRSLSRVLRHVPEFERLHDQVFSHLGRLQNEKSLYLAAIDELKKNVEAAVRAGRGEALVRTIDDFAARYPKVEGVGGLRDDAQNFHAVRQRMDQGKPFEALRFLGGVRANTPLFDTAFKALKAASLPDAVIARRFEQAAAAWSNGDFDAALATWSTLAAGRWLKPVAARLARARKVLEQYEKLRRASKSPQYGDRLLAFRALLLADQDRYLAAAVEADFERYKERLAGNARAQFRHALMYWQTYRGAGGIQGLQRLEHGVSAGYRRQASHLRKALDHARAGRRIYQQLRAESPDDYRTLYAEIVNEVVVQRRSLNELSMVLSASVLQAKLALIPKPDARQVAGQPAISG